MGVNGFDLGDFYAQHRLQAYESVAVHGLPNRWILVGPYSWTGTGWHFAIESSSAHAVRAITEANRRGIGTAEISSRAQREYHRQIRRQGRNIQYYFNVRNHGLRTYYVDSQGDTPYIRPTTVLQSCRLIGQRYVELIQAPTTDVRPVQPVRREPAAADPGRRNRHRAGAA